MNLIDRLRRMADLSYYYLEDNDSKELAKAEEPAMTEAIETVRAMQEALRAAIKAIENEGLPYRSWHGDVREALRRAEGNAG